MDRPPAAREGQGERRLERAEFARRFLERFADPRFRDRDAVLSELERIAWQNYERARKSPTTRPAGSEFADPDYDLSTDWLAARQAVRDAASRHADPAGPSACLLICASPRNDKTCPGEMSKTFRLAQAATQQLEADGVQVDLLDLSVINSEFGKQIHPCKGCVSTAMPLCHWPCSCYPNHSLGQVNDWMHDIYPRWVAAHGIMIITPVHWYQAPSVLKLMIDRLVCADGGNPDPTTTHGKSAAEAKALELRGWKYPRHLAGRSFAIVVHGDAAGAESVRQALGNWLSDMHLVQAGSLACIGRYVGYLAPYATSHAALDGEPAFFEEVRNAARALSTAIGQRRSGLRTPDEALREPRPR